MKISLHSIRGPALVAAACVGALMLPSAATAQVLFQVSNTNDAGAGSLRAAIVAANAVPVPTRIIFNIAGAGPHTITPATDLPAVAVTGKVQIDGYSQPGSARATSATAAVLQIEIDATNTSRGLQLNTDNSSVSGLVIRSSAAGAVVGALCVNDGICVIGDRNVITGNYIGMGVAGLVAFGNNGDGVDLKGDNNVVGGTAPGDRNVISANGNAGVLINGAGNRVEGNLIGLSANGTGAFGNGGTGVSVSGDSNAIGGGGAGAGNVISNNGHGVVLGGSGNTVQGNLIGTNAAGTADRGNNLSGVLVGGVDNVVGGAADGEGNVLSGNGDAGVFTDSAAANTKILGNKIGTGIGGNTAIPNDIGVEVQGDNNLVGGPIQGEGNLISGNTSHGVEISEQFGDTTLGNLVQGNLIGTTRNGNGALGNGDDGVSVTALSAGNRIGGTNAGAGNVIAANGAAGVHLFGAGSLVEGNLIGTDDTGAVVLTNGGAGVEISGDGNWVGGHLAGAGNVIAGNGGDGISIAASDTRVMGNAIGTDISGTVALGNAGTGVAITGGTGNRVGSVDVTEPPNTIAFNLADGAAVTGGTDNAIRRNAIFSNGDLGIDLGVSGILLNDVGDIDAGDNDLQNYPVISSAVTTVGDGTTSVTWSLDGQPLTDYRIEFFTNDTCDFSGNGEGKSFLGATTVSTTAASGIANDKTVLTTLALAPNCELCQRSSTTPIPAFCKSVASCSSAQCSCSGTPQA